MDVTIMNPGVIAPSQMPRKTRHAKSPPKLVAAAWHRSATAQTKMLKLRRAQLRPKRAGTAGAPHPLADGEVLERKVLRPLEAEEEELIWNLTPIGRAAVEMAWLGCLAMTSFGPEVAPAK